MLKNLFLTFNAAMRPNAAPLKASLLLSQEITLPVSRKHLDSVLRHIEETEGQDVASSLHGVWQPVGNDHVMPCLNKNEFGELRLALVDAYVSVIEAVVWKKDRSGVRAKYLSEAHRHGVLVSGALLGSLDVAREYAHDVFCSDTEMFMLGTAQTDSAADRSGAESTVQEPFTKLLPSFHLLPFRSLLNMRKESFLDKFLEWSKRRPETPSDVKSGLRELRALVLKDSMAFIETRQPGPLWKTVAKGVVSNLPGLPINPASVIFSASDVRTQIDEENKYGGLFFAIGLLREYEKLLVINTNTRTVHHVDCVHARSRNCEWLSPELAGKASRSCHQCLPFFADLSQ